MRQYHQLLKKTPHTVLIVLLSISSIALLGALVAQHAFDLPPCRLCIYERYPYGIAFLLSLIGMGRKSWGPSLKKAFLIIFLGSSVLTAYHVAVEHEWVPSPTSCQSDVEITKTTTIEDLKMQFLNQPRVTPCHIAPIKIFGLSLAEYNLLLSLGLLIFCMRFMGRKNP